MNGEDNWSTYIIILLILLLFGFNYYTYTKFTCPTCPTCPPIKECLTCPIPSSQGLINYLTNTFINDILVKANTSNFDEYLNKYFILSAPFTTDKTKELFFDKVKKQANLKYLLAPLNITYLNLSDVDKDKFMKKYNIGILPTPLFIIKGMDFIFGFQNDPSVLKIFIDQTLF